MGWWWASMCRAAPLHSLTDGRVLVRSHLGNEVLDGAKISFLAATKATGDFEQETVAGAGRGDLDDEVIQDFLHRRAARLGRDLGQTVDELLVGIEALKPDGQPTVAGMLLFGREPQFFLPQSGLVYVRFAGTEPRGLPGQTIYTRREDFNGGLARVIEGCWAIVLQEMRRRSVVHGLKQEDKLVYPRFAVREALVNAICHRDYRLNGRRVEIRMFADRLEVISPGGLPGYITIDNIVDEHFSRNPRIVDGLYHWGYIEAARPGHRPDDRRDGRSRPTPAQIHRHALFLYRRSAPHRRREPRRAIPEWATGMNERQIRAIQHLKENGRITNREYHELCSDVSPETLRLDLNDLVERGY